MSAGFREHPVLMFCEGERLLGVIAEPVEQSTSDLGVLILVGGPQYRGGSHRLFVQLARGLANAGFASLRFDFRGMGDSTGDPRGFEAASADIGCAIDTCQRKRPQLRRFLLWGLCDGASAALLYLHDHADSRVVGLVLANPWIRTERSQAQTRVKHYYLQRLATPDFWRKLMRGGVGAGAGMQLLRNVAVATGLAPVATDGAANPATTTTSRQGAYPTCMASGLRALRGKSLLLLSENDYTANEFLEYAASDAAWRPLLAQASLTRSTFPDADHTFSGNGHADRALSCSINWMKRVLLA